MLTEAIAALRSDDRQRARDLLSKLLRSDSSNAEYWIWMSAVVDTTREKIYCLESALKLDPTNRAVMRGLVMLGARKASEMELSQALTVPPRNFDAIQVKPLSEPEPPKPEYKPEVLQQPRPKKKKRRTSPRFITIAFVVLAVIGAIAGVYYFLIPLVRPLSYGLASTLPPPSPTNTDTPLPGTPTSTPIPAATRIVRTPIPTDLAGTPLAFLVPATRTPTPLAGYTPHPSYEAYESGVNALLRGDYEDAIDKFDQVIDLDPDLVDVYYMKGEAHRLNGNIAEAIKAYDRATQIDPEYAPAFLGRGRVMMERDERAALRDFELALEKDPALIETNLEIAQNYAERNLWQALERTMLEAIDAGAKTPEILIYLSTAQHNLRKFPEALVSALEGSADDPALLEGYFAVGRAYTELAADTLEHTFYSPAIWPLQTYVAYRPDDHRGWGYLSRDLLGVGAVDQAIEAANTALTLNDHYGPAYRARGLAQMELGNYEDAYADLLNVQRYGVVDYELQIATGTVLYELGEYSQALRDYINPALDSANDITDLVVKERKLGEGYRLRALIYEVNPDNLQDAIREWGWILSMENALEETREQADRHIKELTGEGPTRTPNPSPTSTLEFPENTPSPTSTP